MPLGRAKGRVIEVHQVVVGDDLGVVGQVKGGLDVLPDGVTGGVHSLAPLLAGSCHEYVIEDFYQLDLVVPPSLN